MKNEIVEKIHSVGKVSRIVSKIAKIVTLIGVIACIIVGVMLIFIPADSVKSFNGTASGTIVFDEKKSKMFSFYDEENVLTAMKKLGYSFISFGVLQIALTGISAITIILMIMLVLAMIHIFSYGAELQQESDETV
ncbi:MAG: hypothetical protein K2I80_12210 [Ruminococcus sp.]|nr:hypothetical protein [Ruminococcus sp.]MDE6849488.1 hypothetical protein [Ruminococcus sp.]